jgi:hypothetical protein
MATDTYYCPYCKEEIVKSRSIQFYCDQYQNTGRFDDYKYIYDYQICPQCEQKIKTINIVKGYYDQPKGSFLSRLGCLILIITGILVIIAFLSSRY